MQNPFKEKSLLTLSLVTWIVAVIALAALAKLSVIDIHIPIFDDEILYTAMGRGILNGLHMWKDLFETKPPVIFWISGFSIFVTGSDRLYRILMLSGLFGMTATLGLLPFFIRSTFCRSLRSLYAAIGVLIGSILSIYVLIRGNGFQTETFGVLPSAIAIIAFLKAKEDDRRLVYEIIAGLCFGFLSLLKEPFTITFVLALLLLTHNRKDLYSLIRIILIGGIAALVTLLCAGLFSDYFSIYLPEMLGGRVPSRLMYHDYRDDTFHFASASPFLRGLYVRQLLDLFLRGGQYWGLGIAIALLGMDYIFSFSPKSKRLWWPCAGVVLSVLAVVAMDRIFTMVQVLALLSQIPFGNQFFQMKIVELLAIIGGMAVLGFLLFFYAKELIKPVAMIICGIYIVTFVIALGVFFDQHLIFAIPVLIALIASFSMSERTGYLAKIVPCSIVISLGLNLYPMLVFGQTALAKIKADTLVTRPLEQQQAKLIDNLLSNCRIDRYMLADEALANLQGLTTHSPFQLSYGLSRAQDRQFFGKLQPANLYLHAKLIEDWSHVQVVFVSERKDWIFPFPTTIKATFDSEFTEKKPLCAANGLVPTAGIRVFFRKDFQ